MGTITIMQDCLGIKYTMQDGREDNNYHVGWQGNHSYRVGWFGDHIYHVGTWDGMGTIHSMWVVSGARVIAANTICGVGGPQLPCGVVWGSKLPCRMVRRPQLRCGVLGVPQSPGGGGRGPQLLFGMVWGPKLPCRVVLGPQLSYGWYWDHSYHFLQYCLSFFAVANIFVILFWFSHK